MVAVAISPAIGAVTALIGGAIMWLLRRRGDEDKEEPSAGG